MNFLQSDESEETESRCAVALCELCRYTQRRFWMKWPEFVDECYVAVKDALVSNITLSRFAEILLATFFAARHVIYKLAIVLI